MQITKVAQSDGSLIIRSVEEITSPEYRVRRVELESREEPTPAFRNAMGDLILPALRMIEAPKAWEEVATIRGLSVTHEKDRGLGAVITLLIPLECANSPLVINTPYLPSSGHSEDDNNPVLPEGLRKAVEEVLDQAQRFVDGERGPSRQGALFDPAVAEEATTTTRTEVVDEAADVTVTRNGNGATETVHIRRGSRGKPHPMALPTRTADTAPVRGRRAKRPTIELD